MSGPPSKPWPDFPAAAGQLNSLAKAYDAVVNRIHLLRGKGWPAPVKSEPKRKLDLARYLALPDIQVEALPSEKPKK
jgi:hypothetical protein